MKEKWIVIIAAIWLFLGLTVGYLIFHERPEPEPEYRLNLEQDYAYITYDNKPIVRFKIERASGYYNENNEPSGWSGDTSLSVNYYSSETDYGIDVKPDYESSIDLSGIVKMILPKDGFRVVYEEDEGEPSFYLKSEGIGL